MAFCPGGKVTHRGCTVFRPMLLRSWKLLAPAVSCSCVSRSGAGAVAEADLPVAIAPVPAVPAGTLCVHDRQGCPHPSETTACGGRGLKSQRDCVKVCMCERVLFVFSLPVFISAGGATADGKSPSQICAKFASGAPRGVRSALSSVSNLTAD